MLCKLKFYCVAQSSFVGDVCYNDNSMRKVSCQSGVDLGFRGVLTETSMYMAKKSDNWSMCKAYSACRAYSIYGGLGACPHRKILKISPTEIKFGSKKMISLCLTISI